MSANRGIYKILSCLRNYHYKPRLLIKLIDTLIKPIALYCCEIWGGFGIKMNASIDSLICQLLDSEKTPYEKINIRASKIALHLNSKVTNIGSRGELGRYPFSIDIIVAVLKYYARLHSFAAGSLMNNAMHSQCLAKANFGNTIPYPDLCKRILHHFDFDETSIPYEGGKSQRKLFGQKLKILLKNKYSILFLNKLNVISQENSGKLLLYSKIKNTFTYNKYLDTKNAVALTKIRLSNHWFPIERDRYKRPLVLRENRVCTLCNSNNIGDEIHCMLSCLSDKIQILKKNLFEELLSISKQFKFLFNKPTILLPYLLKGHDNILVPKIISWCQKCNDIFKNVDN